MKIKMVLIAFVGIVTSLPESAFSSPIEACAAALSPADIQGMGNTLLRYASNNLSRRSSQEAQSFDSGGSYGIISGYLDGNSSKSWSDNKLETVLWTYSQMTGYVSRFIPKEGYASFNQCIKDITNKPGIYIETIAVTSDSSNAVVRITFVPPEVTGKNYQLHVFSNGKTKKNISHDLSSVRSIQDISIDWGNPSKDLIITAEIRDGNEQRYTDTLVIPPDLKVTERLWPSMIESKSVTAKCGGDRHKRVDTQLSDEVASISAPEGSRFVNTQYQVSKGGDKGRRSDQANPYVISTSSPQYIAGRAQCAIWADEWAWVVFRIESQAIATVIQVPTDNKVSMDFSELP